MKKSFVNLKSASLRPGGAYKSVIDKIRKDGVCPFCPSHLKRYHRKPVIKTGKHWILTENMYPYKGAKHHLLFVHKKHIEHFPEISPAAWRELHALATFIVRKKLIRGGALAMRFGKTHYTKASVSHLHAHIIAAGKRKSDPIMFRVG